MLQTGGYFVILGDTAEKADLSKDLTTAITEPVQKSGEEEALRQGLKEGGGLEDYTERQTYFEVTSLQT